VETPYSYSSAKRLPWTRILVLTLLRSSLTPQPYIYRLLGPYQFDEVYLVDVCSLDGLGQLRSSQPLHESPVMIQEDFVLNAQDSLMRQKAF
jgi:hypothetical protein